MRLDRIKDYHIKVYEKDNIRDNVISYIFTHIKCKQVAKHKI